MFILNCAIYSSDALKMRSDAAKPVVFIHRPVALFIFFLLCRIWHYYYYYYYFNSLYQRYQIQRVKQLGPVCQSEFGSYNLINWISLAF